MSEFEYKNDKQDLDSVVHSIKKLMNEQQSNKSSLSNNYLEDGILCLTKVDKDGSSKSVNNLTDNERVIIENEKIIDQCKHDNRENIFSYKEMDSLIIRLLTPMLEKWLDKNLPKLVRDILTNKSSRDSYEDE